MVTKSKSVSGAVQETAQIEELASTLAKLTKVLSPEQIKALSAEKIQAITEMVPQAAEAPKALTPLEAKTLSTLEKKIETAQRSFITIADSLRQVRDEQLFRDHYKTFRAYMAQRWEWSFAMQSRWEDAIELLTVLRKHSIGENDLPGNEGQARQLSRVLKANGEDAVVAKWQEVREQAASRKVRISASLIVEVAELKKSDEGGAQRTVTTPAPERFVGKTHVAFVTADFVDNFAQVVAESFAPYSEVTPKGVRLGVDSAVELAKVLELFDANEVSKEMTIRIVR